MSRVPQTCPKCWKYYPGENVSIKESRCKCESESKAFEFLEALGEIKIAASHYVGGPMLLIPPELFQDLIEEGFIDAGKVKT